MTIRWLHLSDIHEYEETDHPRKRMYGDILKAVEERAEKPHFVFLTGDLAFKGSAGEYEKLRTDFISPLKKSLPDAVFLPVPGNHDLVRTKGTKPRLWMTDPDEARRFHAASPAGAEKRRDLLMGRFENYADFQRTLAEIDKVSTWSNPDWLSSEEGAARWRSVVDGVDVAVVGLNTAWLCQDDDDWGRLTPGRGLFEHALDAATRENPPGLLIVLGHHPLEAMMRDENADGRELRAELTRSNALYLHGHLHLAGTDISGGRLESTLAIQAPSAFHGGRDDRWRNGIMWGEADFATGELRIQPLFWGRNKAFHFDAEAGSNSRRQGEFFVYDLPGWTGAPPASLGPPCVPGAPTPVTTPKELAPGWEIVDRAFLEGRRGAAPDKNQTLDFFDGAIPTWNLALCDAVPSREIVDRLAGRFRNLHDGARGPGVTLLYGAGGEGKSTAALQLAARLVEDAEKNWVCLWHCNEEAIASASVIKSLEKLDGCNWIVLVDDADIYANDLLGLLKMIGGRNDVHFLLVARWADWAAAVKDQSVWRKVSDFHARELGRLNSEDALRIVDGWIGVGSAGLGRLEGATRDDAATALLGHAREQAALPEDGSLLGALLMTRGTQRLEERVHSIFDRIGDVEIIKGYTIRKIFSMIAVMHAENQLYLNARILARALSDKSSSLETHVLWQKALEPLKMEAMIGTAANGEWRDLRPLLIRHRKVAEVAVRELEARGDDPYSYIPMLAAAAQRDFKAHRDTPQIAAWTFDLARHFVETRPDLARKVAAAVSGVDPNHVQSLTALSQIHRRTGDPAGAFRALADTGDRFRAHRGVLYEWGTVAGELGEQALSAWLDARSLADGAGELQLKTAKVGLAGLGVAFGELHEKTSDRAYLAARIACGRLGLTLPDLDATARGYFERYAAAESERDFPIQLPKAALDTIAKAVVMAAPDGKYERDDGIVIDTLFFELLLGEPDGYRFTQLLRHVEGGADAGVAAGKAPARAPRRRR